MPRANFFRAFREDFEAIGWTDLPACMVWAKLQDWARVRPQIERDKLLGIPLATGQLVTTERVLMRALGLKTRSVVQRCLGKLQRIGLIRAEPSEAGTLITVVYLAEESHHRGVHLAIAERHEERGFPDAPPASESTSESVKENGELENLKTPPARVRVDPDGGRGEGQGLSEDADEAIRYAQRRLGRLVAGKEAVHFAEHWREVPIGLAEVKRRIDWLASHPFALARTRLLTRIFHLPAMQAECAEFDRETAIWLAEGFRLGKTLETLVAEAIGRMSTVDPGVVRRWLEALSERQIQGRATA